ncbi:MAG TPA: hypothetical protein ENH96_04885 [Chlamydiae bacterium]|nr:hypothetical protein [Candidatus Anoxychlamydiales bacterium]HEU64704.1 hypothetical protein [Chlamydiota bacterium]
MSYLFPVNPINKSTDTEKISAVEKIGDEARDASQDLDYQRHKEDRELEEKVGKLINQSELSNFSKALESTDLDLKTKAKLLEIAKNTAATFLKKELLTIAKSILSISATQDDIDDLDEDDLTISEQLARVVMKVAKEKPKTKTVKNKVDRAKPLDDKSAGFLVHYCKDILKRKIKIQKNKFKSQKLNKEELSKLLKK